MAFLSLGSSGFSGSDKLLHNFRCSPEPKAKQRFIERKDMKKFRKTKAWPTERWKRINERK